MHPVRCSIRFKSLGMCPNDMTSFVALASRLKAIVLVPMVTHRPVSDVLHRRLMVVRLYDSLLRDVKTRM